MHFLSTVVFGEDDKPISDISVNFADLTESEKAHTLYAHQNKYCKVILPRFKSLINISDSNPFTLSKRQKGSGPFDADLDDLGVADHHGDDAAEYSGDEGPYERVQDQFGETYYGGDDMLEDASNDGHLFRTCC